MRISIGAVAAVIFLAGSLVSGQSSNQENIKRVFYAHSAAPQELAELATVIRVVTDIRDLSADAGQKSLTLRGTGAQVAAAEWLVSELDDPAMRPPRAPQMAGSSEGEYRLPDVDNGVVRIFRFSENTTHQALVDIATTIRTMSDIRRQFIFPARRAIVARGTPGQIELAEWLISELDGGSGSRPRPTRQMQGLASHQYRVPDIGQEVVQVFRLAPTMTPQHAVEIVTALRTTADVRKIFVYTKQRAIAVRGTAAELALCEWLVSELDEKRPSTVSAQGPFSHEYRVSNDGTEVVRVFFLMHPTTDKGLWEIATVIRDTADIRKLYACNAPKAIAARGTATQMAMAEQLIRERDRPR